MVAINFLKSNANVYIPNIASDNLDSHNSKIANDNKTSAINSRKVTDKKKKTVAASNLRSPVPNITRRSNLVS